MTNYLIRPEDNLPELDLAALAQQYHTQVPRRRVKALRHRHDSESGLVLELGETVPGYYGRRGAIVVAILGDEHTYCIVSRRPGSTRDEEPIYVGNNPHSIQHVEYVDGDR